MAKEPKPIWDNFVEVAEVQKSARIKFVVAAAVRDGVRYINIREFYNRQKDNKWMPGRDGITIPLLYPIDKGKTLIKPYDGMVDALYKVASVHATLPLSDPANAVYAKPKE